VVELHTGTFADANDRRESHSELQRIVQAAEYGASIGLTVNAGHGLHYHNVQQVAVLPQIVELNIGHAIVARSLFDGFAAAVREMKRLMVEARSGVVSHVP
jgi:pyridoxine 5-phosphate synthase